MLTSDYDIFDLIYVDGSQQRAYRMKYEAWELDLLEMDIAAVRRFGIGTYKGDKMLIKRIERLLAELKEDKADD